MLVHMSGSSWPDLLARVAARARAAGLDLAHPFAVGWFNDRVAPDERLEDFGRPGSLGILLGNTRALWQPFRRHLAQVPERARSPHPLDGYVIENAEALRAELSPLSVRSYFAHTTRPRAVPMQRLAELTGLAALSPVQLSIHPRVRPWFALRVVLIVDTPGPSSGPAALARPCQGCSQPCVEPFRRALALSAELTRNSVVQHAATWLAVRDACPVGRDFRYGEEQLRYHYHLKGQGS
jgi:methylmalonic aciduria homocystinuria type C protein